MGFFFSIGMVLLVSMSWDMIQLIVKIVLFRFDELDMIQLIVVLLKIFNMLEEDLCGLADLIYQ